MSQTRERGRRKNEPENIASKASQPVSFPLFVRTGRPFRLPISVDGGLIDPQHLYPTILPRDGRRRRVKERFLLVPCPVRGPLPPFLQRSGPPDLLLWFVDQGSTAGAVAEAGI